MQPGSPHSTETWVALGTPTTRVSSTREATTLATIGAATLDATQPRSYKKQKHMKREELSLFVESILEACIDKKLKKGELTRIASKYDVSRWTAQRVWKQIQECWDKNIPIEINNRKKGRCGRKPIPLDEDKLKSIPFKQRRNISSMSTGLGVSRSTVHRFIKSGKIRRVTCCRKPLLSTKNTIERIKWCFKNLQPGTIDAMPMWNEMYNVVHVDEK